MANERDKRAHINGLKSENAELKNGNERRREVIRELRAQNTRLSRKVAEYERKSCPNPAKSCANPVI